MSTTLSIAVQKPKSGVGIKICPSAERISCLLLTDDCLLFGKADSTSCWEVKNVLDEFCDISGQLINYQKSILTFSTNATMTHWQMVAAIFSITHNNSLGNYLGCLVLQKRPSSSTFQEKITKSRNKLEGLKANCLWKPGRVVLIQTNLESLVAHTM